jgi:Predicted Zn peptidase
MTVRRKHIRSVAEQLLDEHDVHSKPVNVTEIAREVGVEVQEAPADDELSGFLYRDRKRKTAIIGVNSTHSRNRRAFTTAHELGHFLLHDFNDLHVDREVKIWRRDQSSSEGTDIEEREANFFAAELLMPAKFVVKDIKKLGDHIDDDDLEELAEQYGVSTQAMTFRLTYLGYLKQ